MVNRSDSHLDATFHTLADPTRRGILAQLALGEASVGELAAPHDMSLPAISKHLKVLESAGFLIREKDGRVHRCRLESAPMREAADWIDQYRRFWEGQLDRLAEYLGGDVTTTSRKGERTDEPSEPNGN